MTVKNPLLIFHRIAKITKSNALTATHTIDNAPDTYVEGTTETREFPYIDKIPVCEIIFRFNFICKFIRKQL
jgi:hypothetical protein